MHCIAIALGAIHVGHGVGHPIDRCPACYGKIVDHADASPDSKPSAKIAEPS